MLFQIAWRNIWRNTSRSLVVVSSIIIGIWAGIFILSFSWGLYKNNINESVYKQLSHIQIHNPDFKQENDPKFTIPNSDSILKQLESDNRIASVSSRVIATGMITSTTTASGVTIYGINPVSETNQIGLDQNLIEGVYFGSGKDNEILIGQKLAKKHKLKLKSKVVLTFTNVNSEIVSAAFRVGGIYRSKNISLDEVNVYVKQEHLRELLDLKPSETNEIAILIKDEEQLDSITNYSKTLVPNAKVEDWRQLAPELDLIIESFNLYTYIISGLILLALTFGIVNTMLMSVLERIRELGMLMAIGLNKRKIFFMIMLETIYLTLMGCPIGLLMGWLTVTILGRTGIDISMFSEGLASYGFSSMIYPALDQEKYMIIVTMCLITAILSAIYPAYKALQLNPSEAIRKI
ncbi:MAG: FtsX-like permease family protein [Salegentibacter sp.]|uniref:ABC-type transport system, involved in lipoprotein release, permease component n=1 Tax=Salegentibacter flavus TaxID=287099 RepID=A0A1I4XGS7_9FLAO|nr:MULTISPECIES: FtsX-like permease family protein [Salegentibacter]MDR9458375.1 FtsX-like permease family protein [Salegentibacter sp.]SFN25108.1 ABC-type transport system, involved in lipoprotein release, permease component [Salegentibacter flavus]